MDGFDFDKSYHSLCLEFSGLIFGEVKWHDTESTIENNGFVFPSEEGQNDQ